MTSQIALKKNYSIDEYLAHEIRHGERFEFYNGQLNNTPGGSISHSRIGRNLIANLYKAFETSENLEVFGSDQKVFIPQYNFYLYPDAVVVATNPKVVENETDAIINPILIIEVASPSTARYDRGDKFTWYKSLSSFKEYVLISQDEAAVNLFFQEEADLWRNTDVKGIENTVHFQSIGVALSMHSIYDKVEF